MIHPRTTDTSRPDILLLMTDQQRYDTIAAAGHEHMITPNLDRLVHQGCTWTHAYTPVPICQPARYHTLTGTTARHHGYAVNEGPPLPASLPTLPGLLSQAGYDTRAIGKMHFNPSRAHHGFNAMELMEEHPQHRQHDEYALFLQARGYGHIQNLHGIRNLLYEAPQRCLVPDDLHGSAWVADRTIAYMTQHNNSQPRFCWASWIAPHPPFNLPQCAADLYRDASLPAPLESCTKRNPFTLIMSDDNTLPPAGRAQRAAFMRRRQEAYYAMITHLDQQIGRVLDALEASGRIDNTLIIFTSDHGEMLGDHGSHQKAQPYDSASRIPLIVRYPKAIAPGSVNHQFADLNDMLPTAMHVAGVTHPQPQLLAGSSLLGEHDPANPGLQRDRNLQHISLGNLGRRWATLRNHRYKYTHYYGHDHAELYDMLADPGESTNLLDASSQPAPADVLAMRDQLHQQLEQYEARWAPARHLDSQGRMKRFDPPRTTSPQQLVDIRSRQFPTMPENLTNEDERAAMNTFADEALAAVADEPLSGLWRFDLSAWKDHGATQDFLDRVHQQKLNHEAEQKQETASAVGR